MTVDACMPVDISDEDIYEAMRDISGYLDITPGDFKEVYLKAYHHALLRLTRSVKAGDVMTRDVAFVTAETPLREVAEIMAFRGISGVPVVDEGRRVLGVISGKDFLANMGPPAIRTFMEVVARCLSGEECLGAPIRARCAADLMSSPAIVVTEEIPVMEVAEIFTSKGINRAPVVDRDGRVVGIVSRADVVRSGMGLGRI